MDHGGNIDAAKARWGAGDWIDLSTGINRVPYPVPELPSEAWTMLPTAAQKAALVAAAHAAYRTGAPGVALAGAQAAIQLVPRLGPPGLARILAPTYNEHAAAFHAAGWRVEEVGAFSDLAGADAGVVVNPNNPDGRTHRPEDLLATAGSVGRLIVDESFCDPTPGLSVLPEAEIAGLIVLRSFGKFFGLAGLRLGFAFGSEDDVAAIDHLAGPWPVSGAAIEVGCRALADTDWQASTTARLLTEAPRLDALAEAAGWRPAGGTALFRLLDAGEAAAAQEKLARSRIWSRIFPWSRTLIRLGLPGSEAEWDRLSRALSQTD